MSDRAATPGRRFLPPPSRYRGLRGCAVSLLAMALGLAAACDRPGPAPDSPPPPAADSSSPPGRGSPRPPAPVPSSPAGGESPVVSAADPAPDADGTPPGPRAHASGLPFHGWRRLELRVEESALIDGTVELRRRETRYVPPEGGEGRTALVVESRTRAAALLFIDLELTSTSEVDPVTGATREYLEVIPGEKAKLLRVEPDIVRMIRYRAPASGGDAPLSRWERHGKERWRRPEEGGVPMPLYDYYALMVHLGRLSLERPGDRAAAWVVTSSGPLELEVRVLDERRRERVLADLGSDREVPATLRELRLGLRPLRGEGEKVRGFLQMEGETEVWIEAESGTLLEIRGRIPRIGTVSVVLTGLR